MKNVSFLFYMVLILLSCNTKTAPIINLKKPIPIYIDSLKTFDVFFGGLDLILGGFNATSKSYVLSDSASNVIRDELKNPNTLKKFNTINVNIDRTKNPELGFTVLTSKYYYDKIMVEFYYHSPDLEIISVVFKKPNKFYLQMRGSVLSKQVHNRHSEDFLGKIICKIEIPEKLKNYKVYFEPYPFDEWTIYQPTAKPWVTDETW